MVKRIWLSLTIMLFLAFLFAGAAGARTFSRVEEKTIGAKGIKQIKFINIQFSDLVYRGTEPGGDFKIRFERRVNESDESDAENLFSDISLDTVAEGANLDIKLTTPRRGSSRILNHWFNRDGKWHTFIEISGPSQINIDAHTEFSNFQTASTVGRLSLSSDFTTSTITRHTGHLQVNADFSALNGDDINGSFDINSSFSHIVLMLSKLSSDSEISSSFGGTEIGLPRNTGAVFKVQKGFSGIRFNTSGRMTTGSGNQRILNGGGPDINLHPSFGEIRVRDNAKQYEAVSIPAIYVENVIMPLNDQAWWRYSTGSDFITLRADMAGADSGRTATTLSFDRKSESPFSSITVHESDRGLFLDRINGPFFGQDITGVTFDPPKLWLPYHPEDSPTTPSDMPGVVHIQAFRDSVDTPAGKMTNVINYSLEARGLPLYRIQLVPGVGFISLDGAKLVAYDLAEKKTAPQSTSENPPSVQAFEKGVIRSIHIYGEHMRTTPFIMKKLKIKEGETFTKEEVAHAVKALEDDKVIDYASFVIDAQGNLRIHVYEIEPFTKKFDPEASFSRVGGFGLGAELKVNSTVAPLSEVYGRAQYHWGNEDWTWGAGGYRQFFTTNKLRIGGGYRSDFASNMNWAIPSEEAHLNAFLLGHELENYYHVEGGRGYISQSIGDHYLGRIEYFSDNFSSVDKTTSWSLFNRGRIKEENPPLSKSSDGEISGTRVILDFHDEDSISNYRITAEMENTYKSRGGELPGYTRFFGSADWQMLYWYGNLIKFRMAGGYSNNSLPDQKAFRLGGVNTLRGFAPGSAPAPPSGNTGFTYHGRGDRMFLANIDYFYGQGISLIFFGDIGGVWNHNEGVSSAGLKRDLGIGVALGSDFFTTINENEKKAGFRVNWAVPVGPEDHVSRWTVNFIRAY
jgi:hypothetical protein